MLSQTVCLLVGFSDQTALQQARLHNIVESSLLLDGLLCQFVDSHCNQRRLGGYAIANSVQSLQPLRWPPRCWCCVLYSSLYFPLSSSQDFRSRFISSQSPGADLTSIRVNLAISSLFCTISPCQLTLPRANYNNHYIHCVSCISLTYIPVYIYINK